MKQTSIVLLALLLATAANAQNAENGKRLYMADGCYECHGTTGAGGGATGPRLVPGPLPLEAIRAQLRKPARRMPPYGPAVISDSQIADIAAYLNSIPRGPDPAKLPLLNN